MDFGLQACRSDESEWAWEQERRDWRKLAYRGGWIATRDREGPPKNEMRLTAIPGMPPRPEGWAQPIMVNIAYDANSESIQCYLYNPTMGCIYSPGDIWVLASAALIWLIIPCVGFFYSRLLRRKTFSAWLA
ncbi:hypothetical protein JB92DRAFT_2837879 [Gautieria morchelliformis]|nr:hypothetical protein JB92DRAFT_2837879 [Gautieria morchelliformis]